MVTEQLEAQPKYQLKLRSRERPKTIRELHADLLGKLVVVPGVVSRSRPLLTATLTRAQRKGCQSILEIQMEDGLSGTHLPTVSTAVRPVQQPCGEKCPIYPYGILSDECQFIDMQTLRLQEISESISAREMPRSFSVTLEGHLVDKVALGSRVALLGVFSINTRNLAGKGSAMRQSCIKTVGIITEKTYASHFTNEYKAEGEEKFLNFLETRISKSIASTIFGNANIKKAPTCLLFGGSRETLPDGIRLWGDIDVLIGDPSNAKSRLLKFLEEVTPIAVYTSGKGSSAAALTTSVVKDPSTGEFQLEGGAMVLADGGVVCIDEFDKMRSQNRVAIHEAMEQQTISVAKAGITTIQDSRTSSFVAANPTKGSYDDFMEASELMELQNTILSRFDYIFLVRDIRGEQHDKNLANYVIQLHIGGIMEWKSRGKSVCPTSSNTSHTPGPSVSPAEAGARLQELYIADRAKMRKDKNTFPKALVRLLEAIATISLCSQVTIGHVEEAHRLFDVSALHAASFSLSSSGSNVPPHLAELVKKVGEEIRKKVAVGSKMSRLKLEERLVFRFNDLQAANYAVFNLVKREEIELRNGTKIVVRTCENPLISFNSDATVGHSHLIPWMLPSVHLCEREETSVCQSSDSIRMDSGDRLERPIDSWSRRLPHRVSLPRSNEVQRLPDDVFHEVPVYLSVKRLCNLVD